MNKKELFNYPVKSMNKLFLVGAYQKQEEVVGMTENGIDDAPVKKSR